MVGDKPNLLQTLLTVVLLEMHHVSLTLLNYFRGFQIPTDGGINVGK